MAKHDPEKPCGKQTCSLRTLMRQNGLTCMAVKWCETCGAVRIDKVAKKSDFAVEEGRFMKLKFPKHGKI